MSEFTPLRQAVDTLAARAPAPEFSELERRAVRRGRRRVVIVATATAAVVAAVSFAVTPLADDRQVAPAEQPKPVIVASAVPVWYDAEGLHRGDVVEQIEPKHLGALALVRSGAVYQDRDTRDVWFHPWGGDPRIVGHNVIAGPGGDPDGDTAAWFERYELVVYDTAVGREISRTEQPIAEPNCQGSCAEHYPGGSNFLAVSAEAVVYTSWIPYTSEPGPTVYTHEVSTQRTTKLQALVKDVHNDAVVTADGSGATWALVLRTPGKPKERFNLEPRARLSPSGNYLLAVELTRERHGAVIVDTRTGEMRGLAGDRYPWIAWSYGDMALVNTEDGLFACDAALRTCEALPAERRVLLPTT